MYIIKGYIHFILLPVIANMQQLLCTFFFFCIRFILSSIYCPWFCFLISFHFQFIDLQNI